MSPYLRFVPAALVSIAVLGACGSSKSQATATTTATSVPAGATTTTSGSATTAAPATSSPAAATTTTVASTTNFDSCSVVTQAEASAAAGESLSAGVLGNATVEGGLACVFYGASSPTPHTPNTAQADSVRVVVVKGTNASKWYLDYKSKVAAQPISGYGDQAYYDGEASLSVMKGDYYVRIAVAPAGAPPSLTDEEKLMAAVLPGLP